MASDPDTTDYSAVSAPLVPSMREPPSSLPAEAIAYARQFFGFARAGNVEAFTQPLAQGLPANLTNESGDTLLMLAAYHGHAKLVKVLLDHGADPNRLNDKGQSPLAGVVFKGEDEVVGVLLEGGADPDWGNPSAMQCLEIFKKKEAWGKKFEEAKGRGSGGINSAPLLPESA